MRSKEPNASTPSPRLFPRTRRRIAALPWFLRWPLRLTFHAALLTLALYAAFELIYGWLASRYDLADLSRMPARSIVFDAAGREIGRLHGEDRQPVPLSKVSPLFLQALLAREDDRFYSHHGFDLKGLARATYRRFTDGARQGASTITMQLARNSFGLTTDKSTHRKLLEIALARRIEAAFSKDQILELYVNRIFFGTGIHGIERASLSYFGKPAIALRIDEAAMLAAIIRGPNIFSPFRHYKAAVSGRNMVLDRMVTTGRLSPDAAVHAKNTTTAVLPEPPAPRASWALDAVRRDLSRFLDASDIEDGGLFIHTTIDSKLQAAAESILSSELNRIERLPGFSHQRRADFINSLANNPSATPAYLQGAVTIVENHSGAILASVGGRDSNHTSFNRAQLAKRQAGSVFKPFVYAAAISRGLLPASLLSDDPLQPGDIRSASDALFQPANADRSWRGLQRADWGLAQSRNTMAVRAGELAGIPAVRNTAINCGLGDPATDSAQLYLGNTGVILEDLVSAYSIFPNGGKRSRPYIIDHISDASGRLVFRSGIISTDALTPATAWLTSQMLVKVCQPGGTAPDIARSGLTGPVGGKTGTTDDSRDAWFVGFNPRVSCGIWIGLDNSSPIINGGSGSSLAAPVWSAIMRRAETSGYRGGSFRSPTIRTVALCPLSGRPAGPHCPGPLVRESLPADSIPAGSCPIHPNR